MVVFSGYINDIIGPKGQAQTGLGADLSVRALVYPWSHTLYLIVATIFKQSAQDDG